MNTLEENFADLIKHLEKKSTVTSVEKGLFRSLFFAGAHTFANIVKESKFDEKTVERLLNEINTTVQGIYAADQHRKKFKDN